MTVTATTNRISYTTSGSQTVFPYNFRIFDATDLRVYVDEVLQLLNTHYTVSGVGVVTGGNVTFPIAPPAASSLVIVRTLPLTQTVDLVDHDSLPAETVESVGFDRLVMMIQQLAEFLGRVPSLAEFSTYTNLTFPDPSPGLVLQWNAGGTGLQNTTNGTVGPQGPQGIQGVPGAGASPTITDGVTSVAVPSSMEFLIASGFAVTEPSAGVARVNFVPVSIPPGLIAPYAGASAPTGWLLCDGAAVSRATFAALFAALGETFGVGDGSTTFNVPDLRGRVAVGAGTGAGLTARTLAATGGEEAHVLTIAEMPAHTHLVPRVATANTGGNPVSTAGAPTSTIPTQSTGGDGAHNTMPPFCTLLYVIKV